MAAIQTVAQIYQGSSATMEVGSSCGKFRTAIKLLTDRLMMKISNAK